MAGKKEWFIGCSGFQYKHWKDIFYPEKLAQKKWFHYYSEHFSTVELNVTFYRFPNPAMVNAWYEKSDENFTFTVKAPRLITHYKKLHGTEKLIEDFYSIIKTGLKEKLGCVLFQFPPQFKYSEEKLQLIISSLNLEFSNVIEFRDPTWWNQNVYSQLGQHNISFCGTSHPLLPDQIIKNCRILYYRLHGVPELYKSPYSEMYLNDLVKKIKPMKNLEKIFLYFNNDIDGSAFKNASQILKVIK